MYLRPGQLWREFLVEHKSSGISPGRRVKAGYADAAITLNAVLAQATPREIEQWHQRSQHPISHILTQKGSPKAAVEDRLKFGERQFYIQGVDNPGDLGHWTIYYCEERFDGH